MARFIYYLRQVRGPLLPLMLCLALLPACLAAPMPRLSRMLGPRGTQTDRSEPRAPRRPPEKKLGRVQPRLRLFTSTTSPSSEKWHSAWDKARREHEAAIEMSEAPDFAQEPFELVAERVSKPKTLTPCAPARAACGACGSADACDSSACGQLVFSGCARDKAVCAACGQLVP